MRKRKQVYIAVMLMALSQIASSTPAYAVQKVGISSQKKTQKKYSINQPYRQYPKVDDSLATQEKMEKYQIPETVLKNMSTRALLETVAEYPMNTEFMSYDSYEIAIKEISKKFNGLKELLGRSDLYQTALTMYLSSSIPKESNADYDSIDDNNLDATITALLADEKNVEKVDEDMKIITMDLLIETILAQGKIYENFTEKQKLQVIDQAIKRKKEKAKSELYTAEESTFLQTVLDDKDENPWKNTIKQHYLVDTSVSGIAIQRNIQTNKNTVKTFKGLGSRKTAQTKDKTVYVKTPKGSKVKCTEYADNHYNSKAYAANYKKSHPWCKIIEPGNSRNNCHAYTWARSVHLWMNNPSLYVDDGSYYKVGSSRPTKNGQIVADSGYGHSAYVSDYTKEDPLVISKRNGGPVIEGPVSKVFESKVNYYQRYK